MTKPPRQKALHWGRWRKLLRIGQAHLAPGMNLARWQAIMDDYQIPVESWSTVPDSTIDAIIEEIGDIVKAHRDQAANPS